MDVCPAQHRIALPRDCRTDPIDASQFTQRLDVGFFGDSPIHGGTAVRGQYVGKGQGKVNAATQRLVCACFIDLSFIGIFLRCTDSRLKRDSLFCAHLESLLHSRRISIGGLACPIGDGHRVLDYSALPQRLPARTCGTGLAFLCLAQCWNFDHHPAVLVFHCGFNWAHRGSRCGDSFYRWVMAARQTSGHDVAIDTARKYASPVQVLHRTVPSRMTSRWLMISSPQISHATRLPA